MLSLHPSPTPDIVATEHVLGRITVSGRCWYFQHRPETVILPSTCSVATMSGVGDGWSDSIYRRWDRFHHSQSYTRTPRRLHCFHYCSPTKHHTQLWCHCRVGWRVCCRDRTTQWAFYPGWWPLCPDTGWEPALRSPRCKEIGAKNCHQTTNTWFLTAFSHQFSVVFSTR